MPASRGGFKWKSYEELFAGEITEVRTGGEPAYPFCFVKIPGAAAIQVCESKELTGVHHYRFVAEELEQAAKEFKAKGAPVDWVTTADPVPAQSSVVAISAHAPYPNAARLFLDYFLSKKGQMVMQEGGNIAARADILPPTPSLDQGKLKLHYVDPGLAEHYNQYQKEYQQLFQ